MRLWFLDETGSIDLNITNGTAPYDTTFSPNINQLNNLPSGEYQVTVIDQNGCSISEELVVLEGLYSTSPIHVICSGDIQPLSVLPGTGATFTWSPSIRLSCTDCPSTLANPRRSTTYTVTATLPDGRSASQNVVVIVLPSIVCGGLTQDDDKDFAKLLSDVDLQNITQEDLDKLEEEIANQYLKKEVKVVPNPTNGIVNIITPETIKTIEVFDFSGKKLKSEKEKQVDLSNLSKGVYFFRIKIENQVIIKKVILL